jgi:arginyl-tRNA synthetase
MSILLLLQDRLSQALADLVPDSHQRQEALEMIRQSQDPKFGDYQANFAMPLGKRLGRPPRDVAADVVGRVDLGDFCQTPEVAGPGFINLRIRDDWLAQRLAAAVNDERLGVAPVAWPRTYVVDYSAPNVAKPMHVGHIRSTVIGDSLVRVLRFLGHRVVSDNHIGDWGTQFGMIIYGYKHFLNAEAYRQTPVAELSRLYRRVRQLMDYHEGRGQVEPLEHKLAGQEAELAQTREAAAAATGKQAKDAAKQVRKLEGAVAGSREAIAELKAKLAKVDNDPALSKLAAEHAAIGTAVLEETAKLHAGDEGNLRLWREFLPHSEAEMERIYQRLGITFDHTLGESFYHDRLGPLVAEFLDKGLARQSDGAICVFLDGIDAPMLIRKKDGAFLYGTTDLATLRYRLETFHPDAILYVVDFRQGLHFEQLFATARKMGHGDVELQHVSFGTVLGEDNRPFKTRSGDTVGLEGLLDEAVRRAAEVVKANDDAKPDGPELSAEERQRIAEIVGIGALKYADLSQNRTSDYVFSYDKMLAMNGNTATYMQYAYARVRSIFARGKVDVDALRASGAPILLSTPAERALGLELLRFGEAIELVVADYRPNQLTSYLFTLADRYSTFYEQCPVIKAEPEEVRRSRLLLCDLTARTIRKGLELLGIEVVDRM